MAEVSNQPFEIAVDCSCERWAKHESAALTEIVSGHSATKHSDDTIIIFGGKLPDKRATNSLTLLRVGQEVDQDAVELGRFNQRASFTILHLY